MGHEAAKEYLDGLDQLGMRFGLERMQALMDVLGSPQLAYRTVHVVGTNGKTSTTRFIAGILAAHGLRVGAYISPHLVSPAERQLVDGLAILESDFWTLVEELRPAVEEAERRLPDGHRVTQFEFLTALAFEWFRRQGCEAAIIEAGLGGRLDATSVIESDVQVLTSVGLDHTDYLGHSLEAILAEKAAVVRRGGKVMAGPLVPELKQQLRGICRDLGAEVRFQDEDVSLLADSHQSPFDVFSFEGSYSDLTLGVLGLYQRENAGVAIGAAELFMDGPLDEERLRRALAEVRVPGRMEVMSQKPLCILDGAHNPQGMAELARALDVLLPRRRLIAVVSVLRDKDAEAMLAEIGPRCDILFFTENSSARSHTAEELTQLSEGILAPNGERGPEVFVDKDPCSALRSAYKLASSNQVVLVTGSLYLIADVKRNLTR